MAYIAVNGAPTTLNNIFDLANYLDSPLVGRDVNEIFDEWETTQKTYYFINNTRFDFELVGTIQTH